MILSLQTESKAQSSSGTCPMSCRGWIANQVSLTPETLLATAQNLFVKH